MKKLCAALILIVSCAIATSPARADVDWTVADTAVQASLGALLVVDYIQTDRIVNDPQPGHRESNPMLRRGEGGLGLAPELYFAGVAGLHTIAAVAVPMALPESWRTPARRIIQGVAIGIQVDAVRANWQAGYTLTW